MNDFDPYQAIMQARFTPAEHDEDQPSVQIGPYTVWLWFGGDGVTLSLNVTTGVQDQLPDGHKVDLFLGNNFVFGHPGEPTPPEGISG